MISNHGLLSALKILNEYRNQTVVENRFKFIKDPIFVGPLHIKRKDRLEALCYVALLELAFYMVLQIRVRKALEDESEPITLAGKKKSFEPTASKILELFAPLKVMWLTDGNIVNRLLPKLYSEKLFERVLVLYHYGLPVNLIRQVTGYSLALIKEHLALVDKHFPTKQVLVDYLSNRGVELKNAQ